MLEEKLPLFPKDAKSLIIYPLYAALPPEQQLAVFTPTPPDARKVILSTNIAESSVTIPGIKYVVDSGMIKIRVSQTATGLESLLVTPVSKSHAWQRSGRAGRESPGKVGATAQLRRSASDCFPKRRFSRCPTTPCPKSSGAI